ncbi:DNA-3-methyladenine glycosylase family protein [Natranaerofaba carboxydovora]|uniref:DNA-3-methyladenine glycosylase family protein n=1 Tax=Natranaerofaba carboxydovora TaxID=2742683 RepID=UPI001F145C06|nr:DNA-3-methyladenine glycosylase [Natranaerofaba carboxydovora]UMZ74066.1 DNA-3-methyladenine glycosylase [Natranaerofaba carboxydovora]
MPVFEYGQKEIDYLKKNDKILGEAIDKMGIIEREVVPDPFKALIISIVGQQISNKAAATVRNRLYQLLGTITPENIMSTEIETIQSCGMSKRKATYIKGIAKAAIEGEVDFDNLNKLADQEIIKELSSLYGVGVWTAEMILIFSLERPDVVSYRDLGIRKGMMKLYGLKEVSKEQFKEIRARYSPYGTVASLYLWEMNVL